MNENKILNIIIILLIVLGVVGAISFGVLIITRRSSDGAISQITLEQQRKIEIKAFDMALDQARLTDKDFDGLTDEQEKQLGTDPNNPDTDNDGILDQTEIDVWKTDPLKADTDDDGKSDGYEAKRGLNPLVPNK